MALQVHDAPVSHHLGEAFEAALTAEERRRIAARLARGLASGALLVVGLLHRRLFPGQEEITGLMLAAGALVAVLPVLRAATRDLLAQRPHFSVEQLVALALLAAMAVGDFETAILVPLLMEIGHFFEERSILGARAAIEGLMTLRPSRAFRLGVDGEEEVPVRRLVRGDRIVVRPGEAFPADGIVARGNSAIDQSTMTGESLPEEVAPGARVFAGTVNLSGLLEVEVTDVAEATAIGRIVELLREAERSKPPIVKVIERYAGYYLPGVLLLAAAVLAWSQELSRAIAILVASCPCALVLASPSAMTAALALASRLGVLVKNTRFLEVLGEIDTLILDKTGTVTMGRVEVVQVRPLDGGTETEMLAEAAACARGSRHPVAQAVAAAAGGQPGDPLDAIEEVHGQGVRGQRNGSVLRLGSAAWLRAEGIPVPEEPAHNGPVVWLARDRLPLALFLLADRPRPGGREAITALHGLGVRRVLLMTGDRPEVAEEIGKHLGIGQVLSRCLPEAKLQVVEHQKAEGHRIMVVGDGVNDALALGSADIGVAMGAMGSDVAVKSADVALMGTDLARLPQMIRLARRTRATIHQNLLLAVGSSAIIMVLAGLGVVSPIMSALVQNVGTFLVILNSGRLLRFQAA
jgi:Cd2+/Zn2+-exporting ATPase/Cu+-exporting ATPase